ncbi:hypothetical protein D3Z39_16020, partial [Anaerotruncus colihominis]|nr:hypothetical protein [Anaerotruncus colihominis]
MSIVAQGAAFYKARGPPGLRPGPLPRLLQGARPARPAAGAASPPFTRRAARPACGRGRFLAFYKARGPPGLRPGPLPRLLQGARPTRPAAGAAPPPFTRRAARPACGRGRS